MRRWDIGPGDLLWRIAHRASGGAVICRS
jgi:hypothetical protein